MGVGLDYLELDLGSWGFALDVLRFVLESLRHARGFRTLAPESLGLDPEVLGVGLELPEPISSCQALESISKSLLLSEHVLTQFS